MSWFSNRNVAEALPKFDILVPKTSAGERIYAIGDIHGRYDLLRELLDTIGEHSSELPSARKTHLIFLGDLIDRGPDSAKVLEYIYKIQKRYRNVIVLLGNHEELALRALRGERGMLKAWMRIGGRATLRSFGIAPPGREDDPDEVIEQIKQIIPPTLIEWLTDLPLMAQSGDYLFCHAGIRPGVALQRQSRADMLWIRDEFLEDPAPLGVVVVHGHSISLEVEERPNRIGIDTGAYKTGVLTALYMEDEKRVILSTESLPPADIAAVQADFGDEEESVGVVQPLAPLRSDDAYRADDASRADEWHG